MSAARLPYPRCECGHRMGSHSNTKLLGRRKCAWCPCSHFVYAETVKPHLTRRQADVLRGLAADLSPDAIARRLGISRTVVYVEVYNVKTTFGLRDLRLPAFRQKVKELIAS